MVLLILLSAEKIVLLLFFQILIRYLLALYMMYLVLKRVVSSTSAHVKYYTALPEVWGNSAIFQVLFGYGVECSGCPYCVLFSQYASIGAWVTETYYINFIVGRGVNKGWYVIK